MNCPTSACAGTLIPGQMIEVAITPTKEGRHHFLCDNFCGDGHDAAIWSWLPG